MTELFWLSDARWQAIAPFMPTNKPGARRKDDRRINSGVLHVIKSGCSWADCPAQYGPSTTVYNRFNWWSRRGFWKATLAALARAGWSGEAAALDATYVRAQRAVHDGKGACAGHRPITWGPTTKIHVLTDVIDRPGVIPLTPGSAGGVRTAPAVLAEGPGRVRRLVAGKDYNADWLRRELREQGTALIGPGSRARKRKIYPDEHRHR